MGLTVRSGCDEAEVCPDVLYHCAFVLSQVSIEEQGELVWGGLRCLFLMTRPYCKTDFRFAAME